MPNGSLLEIDVGRAGQRIRDDQRRAGQIVGLHIRVDAAFEIAIAGEHAGDDQVVLLDGLRDRLRQRAAVADARRAAVADRVEADLFQILVEPGLLEVIGHDARAGREARLHMRRHREPLFDRLLGQQAGGDHHARIARVRATRDRGDHDVAVLELELLAVPFDRHAVEAGVGRRRGRRRIGGALRLDLVAAFAFPAAFGRAVRPTACRKPSCSACRQAGFMFASGTRSCGRFGPARLGSTVDRSSRTTFVNFGTAAASVRNRPCSFVYRSTSSTSSFVRPVCRR